MDGNYEWQRFRTNERLQSRRRDAEAHRLAKVDRLDQSPKTGPISALTVALKVALPLLIGLAAIVWLLTG